MRFFFFNRERNLGLEAEPLQRFGHLYHGILKALVLNAQDVCGLFPDEYIRTLDELVVRSRLAHRDVGEVREMLVEDLSSVTLQYPSLKY